MVQQAGRAGTPQLSAAEAMLEEGQRRAPHNSCSYHVPWCCTGNACSGHVRTHSVSAICMIPFCMACPGCHQACVQLYRAGESPHVTAAQGVLFVGQGGCGG